ncbi:hypothetical protein O3M35_012988 [Rhynocoris fuscipes]|uniref:Uncharacterized protein n=1 Tax=Rhynocoris fuscipes TaxID=488301 RepID=A0AAW1CHL2_9HEMI
MSCPSFFTLSEENRAYRDDTPAVIYDPQDMTMAKVWKKRRIPLKQYRVVNIPVVNDYSFCNYGVRSTKPEIKQKWRDYVDINPNATKSFLKRIPPRK